MPSTRARIVTLRGIRALLLGVLLASVLAACAGPAGQLPPPPDGAQTLPATGDHEVATDLAVADIYDRYGPEFGSMEASSYLLADSVTWADVERHYADALTGWEADGRFPPMTGDTSERTWVAGDRVVVVRLFDTGGARVLIVASNDASA